jgi:site-specific DNA recombinase
LGVYLFPFISATKLHFFLGVFLHFITGTDRRERRRLMKNEDIEETANAIRRTADIIRCGPEQIAQFDEELFRDLVERITAESQTCLRFRLYGGLELTEHLREAGR